MTTDDDIAGDGATGLKLFLSYSRKDGEFVLRLAEALAARGYVPDFDQSQHDPNRIETGISAEDEWWERLEEMIAGSDVMVLLVSPDSAASEVVESEIRYARSLGKRLISILVRPVDFGNVPSKLAAQNVAIDFSEDGPGFDAALGQLCAALDVHVRWRREGRELAELAGRWRRRDRSEDLLIRRGAVAAAEAWAARRPSNEPEPGPIVLEFIEASHAKEIRDARARRRTTWAAGTLGVLLIAVGVAFANQAAIWSYYESQIALSPMWRVDTAAMSPGETFKECGPLVACPEMVVVPGGTFTMGAPETEEGSEAQERPQREVTIARFAVGRTEVTFDQWNLCVAHGPCETLNSQGWGEGDRPVINASWDRAQQYVAWLNESLGFEANDPDAPRYRLLTEAEWEYAARAGSTTAYSFGDDPAALGDHAWYDANSEFKTQPVGQKLPNAFGLHDMHGNVGEWVEDCEHETYENAPTDGSAWMEADGGDCSAAVFRGGAWYGGPEVLRSAIRDWVIHDFWSDSFGFRISRTLPAR